MLFRREFSFKKRSIGIGENKFAVKTFFVNPVGLPLRKRKEITQPLALPRKINIGTLEGRRQDVSAGGGVACVVVVVLVLRGLVDTVV